MRSIDSSVKRVPRNAAAAERVAEEFHDVVRSTAQLEYGLSRARDLDTGDRASCSAFLAGVLKEHPQYTGLLTIRPDGRLFCDSLRSGRDLLLTDRRYFQQALAPKSSLALEPAFGRLTGKAVLQIAYPARDDDGAVKFVLLASLDLDKFMRGRARGLPYDSAVLMLLDRNGTLLTWHPHGEMLPGASLAGSALHRLAQQRDSKGTHEEIESGGVTRAWAVAAPDPREVPGADLAVLVGVSRSELTAAADRRLKQTLIIVAVIALLDFSRLGRSPLAAVPLDMEALARGALDEVAAADGAAPGWRCEIGPLPAASGDPTLIRQVWVNLLSNAVKFSGKHGDPAIMVTGSRNGAEQVYSVKDNGAGFDMRYYDKLFGVFQRLHRSEDFPGTGVGLAIVKRVVERHGGRVWAESRPGEGAAFYFSLPAS